MINREDKVQTFFKKIEQYHEVDIGEHSKHHSYTPVLWRDYILSGPQLVHTQDYLEGLAALYETLEGNIRKCLNFDKTILWNQYTKDHKSLDSLLIKGLLFFSKLNSTFPFKQKFIKANSIKVYILDDKIKVFAMIKTSLYLKKEFDSFQIFEELGIKYEKNSEEVLLITIE